MYSKGNNARLSIIIPFYNSENNIDNVFRTMEDNCLDFIELVFVDDGSKDNTTQLILDKFGGTEIDFKIITQANSGVSTARNTGINHSNGDYILFLDSDDALKKDSLPKVINDLTPSIDVYVYEYNKFNCYREFQDESRIETEISDGLKCDFYTSYICGNLVEKVSVCSCVYRREFLISNRIFFDPQLAFAEDQLFLINSITSGRMKYYNSQVLLGYYSNPESVTSKYNERRFEAIEMFESLKKGNRELSNALNFRINLELVGILRLYIKENSFNKSLSYYLKRIKGNVKRVNGDINIDASIDYLFFVNFGLLYVVLYKAYHLTREVLWTR